MIVKSLELQNFRNYESLSIRFDENTNILYGQNAQGKTNILEAIHMTGTSKSHKGSKDKEIIRFGEEEAHIKAQIEKDGSEYQVDLHLRRTKSKGIAINRVPIRKATELFGILNLVVFSPEDLGIIKEGPAERRKFMDAELCQLDKVYLYDLSIYNKALDQRNKLLKDIYSNPSLEKTLDVWNEQLVSYGKKIIARRMQFCEVLDSIMREIHSSITGEKEQIQLVYQPDVSLEDYEKKFSESRGRDIRFGQTHVGPHKDDIVFMINGNDARKYGSQGQQRTCALSLKLSEIELVKRSIGGTPVLLLDDVLSELDSERQNLLLNEIHDIQTIITCTGLDEFIKNRFQVNKVFQVRNGQVFETGDVLTEGNAL